MMTDQSSTAEYDIGPVTQIPLGEGRNFSVGGRTIAVFRTHAGEVYATQPDCPHKQGPLADGLIGGGMLVCPLHERTFDLRTGSEVGANCQLTMYSANLTDAGTMILSIPESLKPVG